MTATGHEPFCMYQFTADYRDLRPVACGACSDIWDSGRGRRRDVTCWGVPAGSKANGVINLVWLLVLAAAVLSGIVYGIRA